MLVYLIFNLIFFIKETASNPLIFDISSLSDKILELKETLLNTNPASQEYINIVSDINKYEVILAKGGSDYSYNNFLMVTSNYGIYNLLIKGTVFSTSVSYLDCMIPLITILVSFSFLITMNSLMGKEMENGYSNFVISNYCEKYYFKQKFIQSLIVFFTFSLLLFIPTICFALSFDDASTLVLFNNESVKWFCLDLSVIKAYYLITYWLNSLLSIVFIHLNFVFFKKNKISIFISSIFIIAINSCDSLITQFLTFSQINMIIYFVVKIFIVLFLLLSFIYIKFNKKKWNYC